MAVLLPLAALVFAVTVLAVKAWPAIRVNGWYFLYGTQLDLRQRLRRRRPHRRRGPPQGAQFGAWAIIWGTLASSLIAIVIAVPLSIGAAFALTERMPAWISRPLGFTIEILAGIPSVVIGLWGILTFGPWLAKHVYPVIARRTCPTCRCFSYFRNPVGTGEGLLSAGIVLALMIVPIIASTTRDLFLQVPPLPKEGGVRARHDRLGGGQQGHAAVGALGHHRRHRARPGPGAGRDDRHRHDRRRRRCASRSTSTCPSPPSPPPS